MSRTSPPTQQTEAAAVPPDFLALADDREPGTVVDAYSSELADALRRGIETDVTVAWIQGQSCSGCTMSLLQSATPEIERLVGELRSQISFHTTLMQAAGDDAMSSLAEEPNILIVEGAVPTQVPSAATLGTDETGQPKPIVDWILELGEQADIIIAAGTCSSFGGLPAAGRFNSADVGESQTGAYGLQFDGRESGGIFGPNFRTGRDLPVINVPGCPLFPDHLLLTLGTVLNGHDPRLDEYNRPLPLFEPLVHDDCALREEYECFEFAASPGDGGCLYENGCAGVYANCDCSERLRNGGTTVCRNVGANCIGCTEPAFWDRFTPFYQNCPEDHGDNGTSDDGRSLTTLSTATSDRLGRMSGALLFVLLLPVLVPLLPVWLSALVVDRYRSGAAGKSRGE